MFFLLISFLVYLSFNGFRACSPTCPIWASTNAHHIQHRLLNFSPCPPIITKTGTVYSKRLFKCHYPKPYNIIILFYWHILKSLSVLCICTDPNWMLHYLKVVFHPKYYAHTGNVTAACADALIMFAGYFCKILLPSPLFKTQSSLGSSALSQSKNIYHVHPWCNGVGWVVQIFYICLSPSMATLDLQCTTIAIISWLFIWIALS